MMEGYSLLFNPYAGNGQGERKALALEILKYGEILESIDMTQIEDYRDFFAQRQDRGFILCGGDGTLNRFVNDTAQLELPEELYYCAAGSGNDFLRDIKAERDLVYLTPYLRNLPVCEVNGKKRRFLNGVGYGIDGYCCEKGDEIRDLTDAPVNYTRIAIGGVLRHFQPVTATIVIDGRLLRFRHVWLASTMKGRYCGGGMMAAPDQDRLDPEGELSLFVFHGSSRIKTLTVFPSIFKGEHIRHEKCTILTGKDITVLFDRPAPLQIDGETIKNVTEYRAAAREELLEAEMGEVS